MVNGLSSTSSPLAVDVVERVALLTLNRSEARNALNRALLDDLISTLAAVEALDDVDVTVLTGADPVFCAGLDLGELGPDGGLNISELTHAGVPWPRRTKPLIGAINGAAVTGGLELALECDFLIASERARFADTHARVGIQPFWGLTMRLPQAVGLRHARQMSATGNFIDAERALRIGLVNEVVPHEELVDHAMRVAHDIVTNDQAAVRTLLGGYLDAASQSPDVAMKAEHLRAIHWQGSSFDVSSIADRRSRVTDRGRSQSES